MVSKIGKNPIVLPAGVNVDQVDGGFKISGAKGEITVTLPPGTAAQVREGRLNVTLDDPAKADLHGLSRSLLANAVVGVTQNWSKSLELVGTGYRAALSGEDLILNLGFSHPVTVTPPAGIKFVVDGAKITVLGIDKGLVGQTAATVRDLKPPEPYKGKGIKYTDEKIRRKAGKAAKSATGPAAK